MTEVPRESAKTTVAEETNGATEASPPKLGQHSVLPFRLQLSLRAIAPFLVPCSPWSGSFPSRRSDNGSHHRRHGGGSPRHHPSA